MSETPLLALPLIEAAQAQKHITHNEALLLLDAAIHLAVTTRSLATPPAAPADGDRYLVAASATGAWAGQSGKLAFREAGAWRFAAPRNGWRLWAIDEQKFLLFDGAAWRDLADIDVLQNVSLLGVNTTADAGNRLSVSSPATLLNHEGAGHQLKINKQAAANTAALLFQTNFSGRAEMGLTGDDNFHFKVSPDGTAWTEAIQIDRTTGAVTLAANSVTNAGLADMATARIKGRATAGSGDPEDLTGTQATTLLDTFTGTAKGLVPASGGGTTNFLRADGTFAVPPGGGGISDGDKGDVIVSGAGTVWTVDKLANQSLMAGGDFLSGLHNPNFELGDLGWTKGTWTIENDSVNAQTGNWVARNADISGTVQSFTNNVRLLVSPGEIVYAEARLKTSAGTAITAARVAIVWYDKDLAAIGTSLGTNYTTDQLSYVPSTVAGAAPAGTVYYTIRFNVTKTAGTVWVDGFRAFRRSATQMFDAPIVNVLDYGAKGDAVTDDTAAIAAALDAGLNVYFPPRRYVIAGNIAKLRDGHVLYGPNGATSGTTNADVGGAKFLVTTAAGAVFSAAAPSVSLNGVNISNITMHVTGTPSWVIDLPTVSGLQLSKVGIWVVDGVIGTGCLRTQKIAPADDSWTASLHQFNCRIPDAAAVYSVDTDVSDSELVGGSYTGGLGVRLRGTGNVKVVASRFDRSSAGGAGLTIAKATESKTAHLIAGNQFDSNFGKGILIDGDFDDALTNTDVRPAITGNQFRTVGAGTFDIYFKNLTGPVLDGGTITGNTHASISTTKHSFDPARWTGIEIFPLQANAVTYAKMQNASAGNVALVRANAAAGVYGELALAASRLLGRGSSGDIAAISLSPTLEFNGAVLQDSDLYKILTADATGQNVATAQPWFPAAGGVTLEAATTYMIEGLLMKINGTTSHTLSLSFGGTATLTDINYSVICGADAAGVAGTTQNTVFINTAASTVINGASTIAGKSVWVRGILHCNAAGTLIPQFTYSVAPGAAPTIRNGSFFLLRKLGATSVGSKGTWA